MKKVWGSWRATVYFRIRLWVLEPLESKLCLRRFEQTIRPDKTVFCLFFPVPRSYCSEYGSQILTFPLGMSDALSTNRNEIPV